MEYYWFYSYKTDKSFGNGVTISKEHRFPYLKINKYITAKYKTVGLINFFIEIDEKFHNEYNEYHGLGEPDETPLIKVKHDGI